MQSFFEEIKNCPRIIIAGNSASGKNTLAKIISQTYGLPYYSFDKLYWGPGWQRPNQEEFKATVQNICTQEKWVFEGGARLLGERADAADCMIYMNVPMVVCLWRAVKRCFKLMVLKQERDTLPEGCHPMINWYLIKMIITYNWRKKVLETMMTKVTSGKKIILLNAADLRKIRLAHKARSD